MEVPVEVLKIATVVYAMTQAIKKTPWIQGLLEKLGGAWVSIALAVLTAAATGFIQYAGDGKVTATEAFQILGGLVTAMGFHAGMSAVEAKAA